jgi:DNA (cytosine-5)-methyltransferase 1
MFTYKWNLKDLENVEPNGYTVFSCFAGGGGSSQGYKMAGYDVIGCNEIDKRQMEIYRHNLKPKFSYLEDIRTFRLRDDLPKELFELDILDASFPCSLFSNANLKADDKKGKEVKFREGQAKQKLDDLAFETIKLVDRIRPKICVFENVKGLLQEKNKWYAEQIYLQFSKIGYRVCHHLINCADLGVPQKRQRVFFFAVRNDLNVPTADIFGTEPLLDLDIREKHISMGEIDNDDLGKEPTKHISNLMKFYRKGDKSLSDIRFRVDGKCTGFQTVILTKKTICNTLRAKCNEFIKLYANNIGLSDYELLQIGSWSQDYDFKKQRVIYSLGMSVPPLAMYRISKEIKAQWIDKFKRKY